MSIGDGVGETVADWDEPVMELGNWPSSRVQAVAGGMAAGTQASFTSRVGNGADHGDASLAVLSNEDMDGDENDRRELRIEVDGGQSFFLARLS